MISISHFLSISFEIVGEKLQQHIFVLAQQIILCRVDIAVGNCLGILFKWGNGDL